MGCDGSGKIAKWDGISGFWEVDCPGCPKCKPCPECDGDGRKYIVGSWYKECQTCHGTGIEGGKK